MDNLSLTIVCILGLFTLATLYFFVGAIIELVKGERKFAGNGFKGFIGFIFSILVLAGIAYCVYRIPRVFFGGVSWLFIEEWGPVSLIAAVLSLAVAVPVFFFYFMFTKYFVKPKEKPFFSAIVLSIVSGLGNSLLIMVINDALNRNLSYSNRWVGIGSGLYLYFILGILLFTVSAMVVRKQLIVLTNDLVYDKRIEIIRKILMAPYDKLQAVEEGKIPAVLNNDTEVISGFVNTLVNGLTGVITMVSCLIYLGTINIFGLLASVFIIGLAVALFLSVSQSAEKLWEKSRDIQNIFFKFITDLVGGFKELYINPRKRSEFQDDMRDSCAKYRETRMGGEFKFVGVSITGEMLFIAVIGIVVFTFSIIFPNIQGNTLRTYVLVYLYMGGIVNQEVYLIPQFIRVLISWRRINELIQELSLMQPDKDVSRSLAAQERQLTLELRNVCYQYKIENGGQFAIGPIQYSFRSGEICFITGGNGSGKSTLAKLLTGIYRPDEGEILLNGERLDSEALGTYFSTVFSDFYLFDKLYGIDYEVKRETVQQYLKVLRIDDKVEVSEGSFSTTKLSTGQRKRIALLISYLEDHQIFLFDEWAADQDPEFRKYFYQSLLPELKARGKMVIAITHDDRYYSLADRVLKMELGQIVSGSGDMALNTSEVASATTI